MTHPGIRWSLKLIAIRKRGAVFIMVGRPRKTGKRECNGRVQRTYENPKAQVAAQPHRMMVPKRFRELSEAESEFGRLMLNGWISPAQYEAGKEYARLAARYRAAIGAPNPSPSGIDLGAVGPSHGAGMADSAARAIKRAYDAAFESCGPVRLQKAIAHHVIHDRKIPDFDTRMLLKIGLDKLVAHFGIDPALQISSSRH